MGRKQEDAYLPNIKALSRVTSNPYCDFDFKQILRNLQDMSKFSSESLKMLFIRYRVSQKYGEKGFLS